MTPNRHLKVDPVWRGQWPEAGQPLLVVLPGRTLTAQFGLDLIDQLRLPDLAAVVLAADQNSWYPNRFMEAVERNQPDLDHSLERIAHFMTRARERGLATQHIALLGFSQGACLASEYIYRNPARWGAVIIFTGGLIGPEHQTWQTVGDPLAGVPTLFTNSEADPWVPLTRTQQTAAVFRALGAQVAEKVYPGRPHEVSAPELDEARRMLAALP